jgi:hypothetical protein
MFLKCNILKAGSTQVETEDVVINTDAIVRFVEAKNGGTTLRLVDAQLVTIDIPFKDLYNKLKFTPPLRKG